MTTALNVLAVFALAAVVLPLLALILAIIWEERGFLLFFACLMVPGLVACAALYQLGALR